MLTGFGDSLFFFKVWGFLFINKYFLFGFTLIISQSFQPCSSFSSTLRGRGGAGAYLSRL